MNHDLVLAEYNSLRGEILQINQQIKHLFQITMTAVLAILAWGISAKDWIILLTPAPIMLVSVLMMLSEMESMFRIATYIMVFIESEHPELNWETRIQHAGGERGRAEKYNNVAIMVSYLASAVVSLYMSYSIATNSSPVKDDASGWVVLAVAAGTVALALLAGWRIARNRVGVEDVHVKVWETVKHREKHALRDAAEHAGDS
ncbi:MAG: hypothetical protein CVT67_08075 [Actinobacteria bacterium HGW-Actinobacteria-7]|nr:MAG: hypothetical protein CVT67_08075 [Actinobacteria bacterium HGW-Actinobacteria-7]